MNQPYTMTPEQHHDQEVANIQRRWYHPQRGTKNAPILVLCDAPSVDAARQSLPMDLDLHKMWAAMAIPHGFTQDDFWFVGLCPPIPKEVGNSKAKEWAFIQPYIQQARQIIALSGAKIVVPVGNNALRALAGKAMAIGKNRGTLHDLSHAAIKDDKGAVLVPGVAVPVFPMLSPKLVHIQPDNRPIMDADLSTLAKLKSANFDPAILRDIRTDYRWVDDLQFLIDNPPPVLSVDTETTGLNTLAEDFRVITVQLTDAPGRTYIARVCADYFPDHPWFKDQNEATILRLRQQIKTLMNDNSIKKIGQGFKYDFKALRSMGIEVAGWDWDTELMARFVNENFMTYGLDDLIRIYVPEMGGYADHFNQTVNKDDMINVPPETMTGYAGGDSDAVFRLAQRLKPLLQSDPLNLKVMRRIHQRALVAFTKTVETYGFAFDLEALRELERDLKAWLQTETVALTRMVPGAVRRKFLSDKKGFKFSRAECVVSTLFGRYDEHGNFHKGDGFGLKPVVFTDATATDPNPANRVPSTSTKDHLPYFVTETGAKGIFVNRYIELAKATKILDTYVMGFYNVVKERDGETVLLPQYNFKTNTKRTQSVDPNGQNFPKRGRWAKRFRRLIRASRGKVLVASDLSQAELRIAAWMANEREMLRIYREDGDIHIITAAMAMGIADEAFAILESELKKLRRFQAKAINFGFIYGAFAKTFQSYAKTQYGVDYTLQEAEVIRERYFAKYRDLPAWHDLMKAHAAEHGYVRSLHGLTRHLPSIYSPDWSVKSGAERNAVNSPVQNFGSDLGVIALTRLAAQADPDLIRPIGFIHDQMIAEVAEGHEAEGMGVLRWVMENPPLQEWFGIVPPLPIKSDPEWGMNLADSTELGDADDEMKARVASFVRKPDWWDDDEDRAFARYMERIDVPDYTVRDLTGERRDMGERLHLQLELGHG